MRRVALGLVAGLLVGSVPARAQDDDFCRTLKAAWTLAKTDPKGLGDQRIAGATLCAPSEANLQCSWLLGTKDNGRATYERFKSEATACFAPLDLKPNVLTIAGADTTSLESPGDDPTVAIIYPGNATVSITIIPSQ